MEAQFLLALEISLGHQMAFCVLQSERDNNNKQSTNKTILHKPNIFRISDNRLSQNIMICI
jgi:hypothetical protein